MIVNKNIFFHLVIIVFITTVIMGCSGGDPVTPGFNGDESQQLRTMESSDSNRYEVGFWTINIDTVNMTAEMVPIRSSQIHYNVLHMLEIWACVDCVFIDGLSWSPQGTLLVDIGIRHPYDGTRKDMTGRDVRGIAIFPGTESFPNHTTLDFNEIPQPLLASKYLVNPDGYTTHYNRETSKEGSSLQTYLRGNMTFPTEANIIGNLHPFKYFYTSEYKRLFIPTDDPDDAVIQTYEIDIKFQQEFTFAYSVDASWSLPHEWPVVNPLTAFDVSANSLEAFDISVTVESNSLTRQGGSAILTVDIFDHQGYETVSTIHYESPDLFYGIKEIDPTSFIFNDGDEQLTYQVTIDNENGDAVSVNGGCDVLFVVEDLSQSVINQDLHAYNIFTLPVDDPPAVWRPKDDWFEAQEFPGPTPSGPDFDVTVIADPQEPWAIEAGEPMVLFNDDGGEKYIAYNPEFDEWLDFAGYPGAPGSFLQPTYRMDAAYSGGFCVISGSNETVSGEYKVRHCMNMHVPGGVYTASWYTGSLNDPIPYLEYPGDVSGGFGVSPGDPVYGLFLWDSAAGYSKPAYTSLERIAAPYNDPGEGIRSFLPVEADLDYGVAPFGVSEHFFVGMAVDDAVTGEASPLACHLAVAESKEVSVNNYEREIDIWRIDFADPLGLYHVRNFRDMFLGHSMPWPVLESPRIVDIEYLPAEFNQQYMGQDQYPEHNWLAVLYTYDSSPTWFIEIFDPMLEGGTGYEWSVPIYSIGLFEGHAYAMDVDPVNFEIYVIHDKSTGPAMPYLTCLEYY